MRLAVCPYALAVYLDHVSTSRGVREVARAHNLDHPSTALRRIRAIEEAREGAEWEEILDRLEADWWGWPDQTCADPVKVLAVFGHDLKSLRAEVLRLAPALTLPDAVVATKPGLEKAVIVAPKLDAGPVVSRDTVLAAIVMSELTPAPGLSGQYVRASRRSQPHHGELPAGLRHGANRYGDLMTPARVQAICGVQAIYLADDSGAALASVLPPQWLAVLRDFCVAKRGFEEIERAHKLPARSAKALVPALLDALVHAGAVSATP